MEVKTSRHLTNTAVTETDALSFENVRFSVGIT